MACMDFRSERQAVRVMLETKPPSLCDRSGKQIGQIYDLHNPAGIEPFDASSKLSRAFVDIEVPKSFVLHRDLNPIAIESAPFIDAFARHHIERITPWKSADTYFGVSTQRLEGAPQRLAVSVHVVARSLLADIIAFVNGLNPSRLRLLLPDTHSPEPIIVPVYDQNHRRVAVRKTVQGAVIASFLLIGLRLLYFPWQLNSLDEETATVEHGITEIRSALAAQAHGSADGLTDGDLQTLRGKAPRAVEILENMSAALPDDAYLTSFHLGADQLNISGISARTSELVPALEKSRHFVDVSFAAATTRLEDGGGDRFHLSMRVAPIGRGPE